MRRTEDAASPTPTSSSTIPRTRPSALTSAASPASASTSNRGSRFETREPQCSSWFDLLTAGCDPTGSPCREEREGDRRPAVYRAGEAPPVRDEVAGPPHSVGTVVDPVVPENPTSARPASARCPKIPSAHTLSTVLDRRLEAGLRAAPTIKCSLHRVLRIGRYARLPDLSRAARCSSTAKARSGHGDERSAPNSGH